jgi:hypothetical protein
MRAVSLQALLLATLSLAMGCEGRELSVFELPPAVAGTAGTPSAAGSTADAGSGGSVSGTTSAGSSSGGAAGGSDAFEPSVGGGGFSTSGGMPGDGFGSPEPCAGDMDCMPGWVCEKPGCDAPTGRCVPWPPFCSPNPAPVCGCNGVTYWNDCIRLQSPFHPQLQSPDLCRANACTCEVGTDCMVPYASCSHLLPPGEMCGHGPGACWVLPLQCDPNADSKMWRECRPPDAGQLPTCLDTCNAIATEHSYAELHRNEACN